MLTLLRHGLSVAVLPTTVTVLIPMWIARQPENPLVPDTITWHIPEIALGIVFAGIGLALFASSLYHFAADGKGTLAPWDPPRRLVVRGPYRYVRNPMISGVAFVLFAEALLLNSSPHLVWAVVFVVINVVYIPLLEEPQLRRRFGKDYDEYCGAVPRLLPRASPWSGRAGT